MALESTIPLEPATSRVDIEPDSSCFAVLDRDRAVRNMLQASARYRLQRLGPQALSDVELLSLLLRSNNRASTSHVAENLLATYGSLRALIIAEPSASQAQGLTPLNYATLQSAIELARRHYQELVCAGPVLSNPQVTREFLRMTLRDLPHEVFCCLYLDNRHRVISFEQLFRGTIDGASVYPREVVKRALACNAAGVILAHNHPSGVAEPSQADELITKRLKDALALVDVRVLDHLIVGDARVESFAEHGLL